METHLRSASDLLARNLLRCSRHNGAAPYGQCDSPILTRFITHRARRSYGCVLRKWTNSYCNEATTFVTQKEMVRVAGVEPAWTCAQDMWVAATLHPDLVARHGIEPYPLAFQTSTLPSSSRAKLWWTVRELNSHFTVAGRE